MWSLGISNERHPWVRTKFEIGRKESLTDEKDLLRRQRRTWANIPARLQDLILQHVRGSLQELITQNNGPEPENTVGYEDDHETLEAELAAREAARDAKRRGAVANSATLSAAQVSGASPARDVVDFHEDAGEERTDVLRPSEDSEGLDGANAGEGDSNADSPGKDM